MGRTADRLPIYSSKTPMPAFDLSDEDYERLEGNLGQPIPHEARPALLQACRAYLHWRDAELHADEIKEGRAAWVTTRQKIEAFLEVCDGAIRQQGDAGDWIDGLLFDALEGLPIALTEKDLEPSGLDPFLSKGHVDTDHQLIVTPNFAMRMGIALRIAIDKVEAEIAAAGPGFRPGSAIDDWLVDVKSWASENGLPFGAAPRGGVSPFSSFLYALHCLLPCELRHPVNGEEAINVRLSRAAYGPDTSVK